MSENIIADEFSLAEKPPSEVEHENTIVFCFSDHKKRPILISHNFFLANHLKSKLVFCNQKKVFNHTVKFRQNLRGWVKKCHFSGSLDKECENVH